MHFTPALRYLVSLSFCVLLMSYFAACTSGERARDEKSIAVHWELMTNLTDKENVFKAKFELKNNSTRALSENNWALFFNMAPRQILTSESPQSASLHHINGDWYKMTPNQSFSLKPNETVVILYNGVEGVIKETDRPLGLYFVFYDDAGNEQEVVEVTDYTWTSFTKPEQIDRNREDEEPIPTTEWSYQNNLDLQSVPDSKIIPIIPSPVRFQLGPDSLKVTNEVEIY